MSATTAPATRNRAQEWADEIKAARQQQLSATNRHAETVLDLFEENTVVGMVGADQ